MVHRIGILGMSEDSNQLFSDMLPLKVGKKELDIRFFDTNFKKINSLLPGPSDELKKLLITYLKKVKRVKYIIVPNITIHQTLDEIFTENKFKFEIIHPLECLIMSLKKKEITKVVLFGSIYTMKDGYVSNLLKQNGIESVFPTEQDIIAIDKIRRVTYKNGIAKKNLEKFNHLLNKYAVMTPVVLASTELSIINDNSHSNVYDAARCLIDSYFKMSLM